MLGGLPNPGTDADTSELYGDAPLCQHYHDRPEIPDFDVLDFIAEGGFSLVYRGEQLRPIRRRVALKVLKQGIDNPAVLKRFQEEQHLIARMDHPHVARVLHAGNTAEGSPFIAMELIEGQPLTHFCENVRASLRDRLALFIDACDAVLHAHQRGIIHRDIKPSNILVGRISGLPALKVIDFGVAKLLDEPPRREAYATLRGFILGTPEYMSPEQLAREADVDVRTDIYSLGVVLYELLAGRHPMNCTGLSRLPLHEASMKLLAHHPVRPSATAAGLPRSTNDPDDQAPSLDWWKELRGDLDQIILKALEKDREDRYPSAEAFAQDIRAFLNFQPVRAASPGVGYRAKKFFRRNRLPATFGAASTFLLLGAGSYEIARISKERSMREIIQASDATLSESLERHAGEIRSILAAVETLFDDMDVVELGCLEGPGNLEQLQVVLAASDCFLQKLPPTLNDEILAGCQTRQLLYRSLSAQWEGHLLSAIEDARKAVVVTGLSHDLNARKAHWWAQCLLASQLELNSRPEDAEKVLNEALFSSSPPGQSGIPDEIRIHFVACEARCLLRQGRAEAVAMLDLAPPVLREETASISQIAGRLAFFLARATAHAEMLDSEGALADCEDVDTLLQDCSISSRSEPHWSRSQALLQECRAEALVRSPKNLAAALRFYDDALGLRLALFGGQPSPADKLAQARNQLDAALWLLDCALLSTESSSPFQSEALKRMDAAAASISTLLNETTGLSDDQGGRRLIVLKYCAEAEWRLLAKAPAEALAFLDKALESSRLLINDFDQDRRHLQTQVRLFLLRAECLQRLREMAASKEALDQAAQALEQLGGDSHLPPRTRWRLIEQYSRLGLLKEARKLLDSGLERCGPNHPATAVFESIKWRMEAPTQERAPPSDDSSK